jgi:hypothetical protein
MKTTIDLPDELVRMAKLRAVSQGRTLRDLVSDCLRLGLGISEIAGPQQTSSTSMVELNDRRVPQFKCRPIAPIRPEHLPSLLALERASLEEEDLKRAGSPL